MQKVCLITGGAGFLGRKYCEFFLKKNFFVICVDNNQKKLSELKSINSKNLLTYNCDITKEKNVAKLFKQINRSHFVNVLVNNAAIDAIPFKKKKQI